MTDAESGTVSQAITAVGKAVGKIPPVFTVLIALNVVFLGADLFYRLEQQTDRTELLKQIFDNCITKH